MGIPLIKKSEILCVDGLTRSFLKLGFPMRNIGVNLMLGACIFAMSGNLNAKSSDLSHTFASPPENGLTEVPCLPTQNGNIYQVDEQGFTARTRSNPLYGFPGWTREGGARFHKGVDILPVSYEKGEQTVSFSYYDPKTKKSYSVKEPVIIPKDEIYSILDGVVVVANDNPNQSGYGKSVTVQHRFADGTRFISMYAHLARLDVKTGQKVQAGERIGWMGNTSSSPGGRAYLRMIPHLHFEIGKVIRDTPVASSSKNIFARVFGRLFCTSNIQPFNPIEFLQKYRAQPKSQWSLNRADLALNPSS
jgi:hypothetical protein